MYKISEVIMKNQDDLAFIEALDSGKPYTIAKKYDIAATAFTFKYYAGWADKFYSKFIPT
jgi:acyl-CoA reductase-like NAD-dependent aldehyde dehydrogenase